MLSIGRGRRAQHRSHTRNRTSPPRASQPRTPTPRAEVLRRPSAPRSASESLDDSDESSDGDHLTPSSSSSSDSSSEDSDVDATFRPSRSPSKFPNQTSPNTRSRSRVRYSYDERVESVANPRRLEVVIRSVPSAAHGSGSSRAEAEVAATQHGEEMDGTTSVAPNSSSAASVRHGWRVVNGKKNRAKTPASSSPENRLGRDAAHRASSLEPGRETSPHVTHTNHGSHHIRASTAGPSLTSCDHHGHRHSSQPRHRSPKGKERAIDQDALLVTGHWDHDQHHGSTAKKYKKKKEKKSKEKEKSKKEKRRLAESTDNQDKPQRRGKGRAIEHQCDEDRTRRPPRLARVEPSIERTPSPMLPAPEPSSANQNSSRYCNHSPGLFVSSPPQPATPGPSRPPEICHSHTANTPSPLPCSSSLAYAAAKRRHVEFSNPESSDGEAEDSDNFGDSVEPRLGRLEIRFDEHDQKRAKQEHFVEQHVALFTEEIHRMDAQFADLQAKYNDTVETLKSLTQQVNEANAQPRPQLSTGAASSGESSSSTTAAQQRPATFRPRVREIPPTQFYTLDLGRRNGLNPPRPAAIPNTLARNGRRGADRQLASQNRVRQQFAAQRPPNGEASGSSSGSRQNNNNNSRRGPPLQVAAHASG